MTACALAVVVVAGAAGCSSDEAKREFSVPKELCGVSVPTEPLSRLLPATGKRLDVGEGASSACEVTVDRKTVLSVERQRVDAGRSAWNIASYDRRIGHAKTADDDTVAYVGRAAVSVVKCRTKGDEDKAVSTYLRTLEPGREDESAMKDLMSGYTDAFEKQQPCKQVT